MALTKITARLDRTRSESLAFRNGNTLLIEAVVLVDADGNPIDSVLTSPATDLEQLGDIAVGTDAVELVTSATETRHFRLEYDIDGTGVIFIGKSDVLNDGTNHYARLYPGRVEHIDWNNATEGLYIISSVAAQKVGVGVLL